MKFLDCRRPFILSSICARLLMSRFVQKIFAIKCRSRRKTKEMLKFLGPLFPWGITPTVVLQIVSAIYHPPFGKVIEFCLLISICEAWQWCRKQNLCTVGKNGGPVWSRLWTKVCDILGRCRRPLVVVNLLNRVSILCFILKIWAVKVAIKLRSRPKRWFLVPQFVSEGIPQILDMHFQIAVTSEHVADFDWVPFGELGD